MVWILVGTCVVIVWMLVGICDGTTVVLYCGNSGETDPADPAGAKKGDAISEMSSLPFPLVAVIIWGPTYGG